MAECELFLVHLKFSVITCGCMLEACDNLLCAKSAFQVGSLHKVPSISADLVQLPGFRGQFCTRCSRQL